jgi:deoxyribodipyrimidine photolyase-like uncharacterized protein
MNNVTYQEYLQEDGSTITYAVIDKGNNEFTSMLKATYEAQQAAQAQPQG